MARRRTAGFEEVSEPNLYSSSWKVLELIVPRPTPRPAAYSFRAA